MSFIMIMLCVILSSRFYIGIAYPINERDVGQNTNTLKAENKLIKPSRGQFLHISKPLQQVAKRGHLAYTKQPHMLRNGFPIRVKISRKAFKKYLKFTKGGKSRSKNLIIGRKASLPRKYQFRPGRSQRRQKIEKIYRQMCLFVPQDAVKLIRGLHLQKLRKGKEFPIKGVLCKMGIPSNYISTPRYYG